MIYSAIARTLRDARGYASSITQLRMLDRVTVMLADELQQYKRFRPELFLEEAECGNGVFVDNTLEVQIE